MKNFILSIITLFASATVIIASLMIKLFSPLLIAILIFSILWLILFIKANERRE